MLTVGTNDHCHFGEEEDEKRSLPSCFSFGLDCDGFLPRRPLVSSASQHRDSGSGGRQAGRQNEKKEEEAEGNADGRDETAVVESSDKNLPAPSFEQ